MKTLKDVLLKRSEIISLAKELGFDPEVKIFCDEPIVGENEMARLVLIVKLIPQKSIDYNSSTYLETLLCEMLGCKVEVRNFESITMYREHTVLHSVPLGDEKEISNLFERAAENIFFDDSFRPHPIGLENARKHLALLRSEEQKNSGESESKKQKSYGDALEGFATPNQENTESPPKTSGVGVLKK